MNNGTEIEKYFFRASAEDFRNIPGEPIAYWVGQHVLNIFRNNEALEALSEAKVGLQTGDNDLFLKFWYEVSLQNIGYGIRERIETCQRKEKWYPCNKGGEFRKWYGNHFYVVNWQNDGNEVRNFRDKSGSLRSRPQNIEYYFKEAISWSDITSSTNAFRFFPSGFINDATGHSAFGGDTNWRIALLGYCNTKFVNQIVKVLNPTMHFHVGYFNKLPYAQKHWSKDVRVIVDELIKQSKIDWDSYETSWNFTTLSLLSSDYCQSTLADTYAHLRQQWQETTLEMQRLEEENNRIFIDAYGLQDELTSDVPLKEITLTCNPHYRYGGERSDEELETLLQCDTIKELVSYAIGCMMGRYSLDKSGLILASQGETLDDYYRQIPVASFAPDDDGILPLNDLEWFADDATNRLREFVRVVWGEESLQQNLNFIAESLCLHAIRTRRGESSLDCIRRYLSTQFFKDHMRMYKNRPIYWLFSSGKHKAFECLVYLHRYNEGTLVLMAI